VACLQVRFLGSKHREVYDFNNDDPDVDANTEFGDLLISNLGNTDCGFVYRDSRWTHLSCGAILYHNGIRGPGVRGSREVRRRTLRAGEVTPLEVIVQGTPQDRPLRFGVELWHAPGQNGNFAGEEFVFSDEVPAPDGKPQ
jgi:hypothetical protein